MIDKDILLAANILFNHRLNKTGLKNLPKKLVPQSIEEAYKIQNELKILYLTLKDNIIIGKKVGCTNKYAQNQGWVDQGNEVLEVANDFFGLVKSGIYYSSPSLMLQDYFFGDDDDT